MADLYEIVLFGATGFTGKLVAEYLDRIEGLHWAIAGRNRAKLEAVAVSLQSDVPILEGDSGDRASLDAIARQAKVVCTTVGPYAKYGSELVAACIAEGADYCDLTGETHWIRRMIDAHHDEAVSQGVRIVHCCGFDSIPSDIGTWMVQDHALREHGEPCRRVSLEVRRMKGGISGGTAASMMELLKEAREDASVRKILGHPYALNPPGERSGPDGSDQRGVGKSDDGWTAPFVMAAINTRIVRRSNALLGHRYGRDFRYQEYSHFPKTAKGLAIATGMAAGLTAMVVGATIPGVRDLIADKLPKSGEGPDAAAREAGGFSCKVVGEGDGFGVTGRVEGDLDPGYGQTAIMLAESALCLARDEAEGLGGGILTPASAMPGALLTRLRAAGMRFSID